MAKQRLDQLLVERGLAESRERAQRLIRAGLVLAAGQRVEKPGVKYDEAIELALKGEACPYVSRGGLKLAGALAAFGLADKLGGCIGLDVGASTGGFTDCLLQAGADHVWAIDTGRGQLHERLRQDARVRLRESANARLLEPDWLAGEQAQVVAIDVSFISLRQVLPPLAAVLAPGGCVVALVKPQFEAGPRDVGKGGVVRDPAVHARVLHEVAAFAQADGWRVLGVGLSPLRGPAGNVEFFLWLRRAKPTSAASPTAESLAAGAPAPPQPAALPALAAWVTAAAELDGSPLEIAIEQVLAQAYTLSQADAAEPPKPLA